jgi:hypothetical protein
MADVDGRREAAAEGRAEQRAGAVDGEGRLLGESVAFGFGAFDVLERADQVEQAHGDDDAEVAPCEPEIGAPK